MNEAIRAKIKQRRRQMLVHSYIYYDLNKNIVSDYVWAKWAKELEQLQRDFPEESQSVEEYEQFKDWDGSSGAFLKFGENIKTVAHILLGETDKISNSTNIKSNFAEKSQKSASNVKKPKSNTRSLF